MKIQVQDQSAKQYDVDAPDGTPIDVVEASATKELGRPVKAIDAPSKTAYTIDRFKKGFSDLAGMAGAPVDAIAWSMRHDPFNLPIPNEPVGGSAQLSRAAEKLTGYRGTPAPSTASEWLIGRPAEFAGAGAIGSANTIARATRPALAAATEAASTYFGGVGSKAGEEFGGALGRGGAKVMGLSKDAQERAEAAGRAAGGFGGGAGFGGGTAMGAPRVGSVGTEWVRGKLVPKLRDEKEIEKVAKSLSTKHFRESLASDPRYKANLEEALKLRSQIPGFEPDLSMAAGTPAVRALQTHAETQSASAAARGVEKRGAAARALREYRDANFPQGEKTLQELSGDELSTIDRGLAAQQADVEAKIETLKGRVQSGQFGPEEGTELENLKREQYRSAQARSDTVYGEVYKLADRVGYQGSLDPVMDYLRSYKRDLNRVAQKTPAVVSDLERAVERASLETKKSTMQSVYAPERIPDGIVAGVARHGGLSKIDLGGELPDMSRTPTWAKRGSDYSFYLVHNGGTAKSADEMLLQLKEDGYLPESASINDMVSAVEDELRAGGPEHFKASDWEIASQLSARRAAELHEDLGARDVEHNFQARYPAGFGPMHSILKRIRQEKRYYAGKSTDEARLAMKPLNDLEQVVVKQIGTAGPEIGERLSQADGFHKQYVAEPFYNGVAAQTFNDRGLIENVARRILTKGEEGARNFKEVYGESERAQDLLWNGVIDSLAARIGERDVTSKAVRAFYENHKKFIDQFPQIRSRLMALDQVSTGLEDRAVAIADQRRAVNRDLISTLVGRPDPEKYLVSIVGNEAAMKNVAAWAKKNPTLGQQILRAYVDGIAERPDGAALAAQHEKTLKPVFDAVSPGMWSKAMTLLGGEKIRQRGAAEPKFTPEVVTDPLRAMTGTGTSGFFSRIRGAVYRQISPEYVLVDIGGKYFFRIHQEQAREAINAALYDPKLIDDILALDHELQLPKPPMDKIRETLGEMKVHYLNHGVRVGIVETAAAGEPAEERKARETGTRALRQWWRGVPGRQSGGPVAAGQPYVVGEKRPEIFVPKVPGYIVAQADAMNPQAQKAYKDALGTTIDARERAAVPPERTSQGVVAVPPNLRGLVDLVIKTGRARNEQEALKYIQEHGMAPRQ